MKLPRKTNAMYSALGGRVNYSRSVIESRKAGHHGRMSLYYGPDLDHAILGTIRVEYHTAAPVYAFGGSVQIEQDEDPLSIAVYLWPFSFYLSAETTFTKWLARKLTGDGYNSGREIRLVMGSRIERGTIRWSLWHSVHSWRSDTPAWRDGSCNLIDAILGRREMRWETIETTDVLIPMPERSYAATCEMRDHVSWRRRLPFRQRRVRCADVDIPGGIGFPGKGENAWDCGDDATYAMSCGAENAEEAIGKVVASVLRDRRRYGGSYEFQAQEATR